MGETRKLQSPSESATLRRVPADRSVVFTLPFKIIAFDWDGTAVVDRSVDATPARLLIERLLKLGVRVVVITGTNFGNVDRQFSSYIRGPAKQHLYVCTNRGSEVYRFDGESKPVVLWSREATPEENQKLDRVAEGVRDYLAKEYGLTVEIIFDRMNRRKIDLIPLPEWKEPPKSEIGSLLQAVEARLKEAGVRSGIREVFELTKRIAQENGLRDARITSDVKHIEVGLTDKSDSINWMMNNLAVNVGVGPEEVLIIGDEFGPVGGFEGSDYRMFAPSARDAVFISVGPEPNGVPAGIIHLGGGPPEFREILETQIILHERLRSEMEKLITPHPLLAISADPTWLVIEEGFNRAREHEIESMFAISNGYLGTRGLIAEGTPASEPATFIAGVFDVEPPQAPIPELVVAPEWQRFRIVVQGNDINMEAGETLSHRRILDMRQGVLVREWRQRDPQGRVTRLSSLRFASLADRHLLGQFIIVSPENYSGQISVFMLMDGRTENISGARHLQEVEALGSPARQLLIVKTSHSDIKIAMAAGEVPESVESTWSEQHSEAEDSWVSSEIIWHGETGSSYGVDKLVAVFTSRDTADPGPSASQHLQEALNQDEPGDILTAHVNAWADRWDASDVEIAGDDPAQRATRFALYHLIAVANPDDEKVSIGARALTGESYKGHVFWDTEIYMLPFYIFTYPEAARALLMYRYHTLDGARAKARSMGYRGALYAWESADTGEEVTPAYVVFPTGEVVPVLSGLQEHHISADVTYAVWQYWQATGDDAFFAEAGAEITLETARFWASRVIRGEDGLYHIREVVGPDEYHEGVDDNAYTNLMAQANLRRGVETADYMRSNHPNRWIELSGRIGVSAEEITSWTEIAESLVTGFDPKTSVFEQFAGFFGLEHIDLSTFEPRTVPMDILLGRERTQRAQVVKQADVIMALYLLWEQFPRQVHEANFRYYEPRTGHGSSLSPSIHALFAARLGDVGLAKKYFHEAMEIDLANNMGNAAGGVHAAALGGLWQSLVFGFGGMSMREKGLWFDPRIPENWEFMRFPIQWRGRTVRITRRSMPSTVEVILEEGEQMVVGLEGGPEQIIEEGKRYQSTMANGIWSDWEEVRE